MNTISHYYRRLKRLIQFIPHIWRGYDFDYRYAIDLFSYQLSRTADMLESDRAMTVDADVRAKRIRTAVELLKKVYEEDYGMEYQDQLEVLYGPNVLDWEFEDTGRGDGSSYLNYAYEKWDNAEEIKEKQHELFLAAQAKQKRAEELVWKFISHNIRWWWD